MLEHDDSSARTVLTYGTFDLFHIGHLRLLQRLRALGDRLIVAVSTDEFNAAKGKRSVIPYDQRKEIVEGLKVVDRVIPENDWDQKRQDIENHDIAVLGMGHDWEGQFDHLNSHCEVVYLPRTENISSTSLRRALSAFDDKHIDELKQAVDIIHSIVENME